MKSRLELQSKLEESLGSRNVYYQPPESLKMEYPAIRYSRVDIEGNYANNSKYSCFNKYEIIVISKKPDHEVIQRILTYPLSSFERHYVSDNLNHDVITLYF